MTYIDRSAWKWKHNSNEFEYAVNQQTVSELHCDFGRIKANRLRQTERQVTEPTYLLDRNISINFCHSQL